MYYHLNGELCLLEGHTAVIDCGGVGYQLTVSDTTSAASAAKLGKELKLYTYLAVREDSMELFGFASMQEKVAFLQLIGVSGVGPKVAISVLSYLTPEQFAAAVISADAKTLSKAKGLGKKGAERIILELQEKLAKEYGNAPIAAEPVGLRSPGKLSDAVNALLVLGYTKNEANEALSGIDHGSMTLEDLITTALKRLMK